MIAPSTEHTQQKDQSLPTTDSKIYPGTNTEEQLVRNGLNDKDYRSLVATLNKDQKEFFYHVIALDQNKRGTVVLLSQWRSWGWKNLGNKGYLPSIS